VIHSDQGTQFGSDAGGASAAAIARAEYESQGYGSLGWLMYVLGGVAASVFCAYLDGFPEGRTPFLMIGLPALPFIVLGKYLFEQDKKSRQR
jgi:hypothetical protein